MTSEKTTGSVLTQSPINHTGVLSAIELAFLKYIKSAIEKNKYGFIDLTNKEISEKFKFKKRKYSVSKIKQLVTVAKNHFQITGNTHRRTITTLDTVGSNFGHYLDSIRAQLGQCSASVGIQFRHSLDNRPFENHCNAGNPDTLFTNTITNTNTITVTEEQKEEQKIKEPSLEDIENFLIEKKEYSKNFLKQKGEAEKILAHLKASHWASKSQRFRGEDLREDENWKDWVIQNWDFPIEPQWSKDQAKEEAKSKGTQLTEEQKTALNKIRAEYEKPPDPPMSKESQEMDLKNIQRIKAMQQQLNNNQSKNTNFIQQGEGHEGI